jgi:hypothetical protein
MNAVVALWLLTQTKFSDFATFMISVRWFSIHEVLKHGCISSQSNIHLYFKLVPANESDLKVLIDLPCMAACTKATLNHFQT